MTLSKKKDKSTETVPEIDLIADLPYKDFFFFLGIHLQHTEVHRLRVKLDLPLQAYVTATTMPIHICESTSQLSVMPDP